MPLEEAHEPFALQHAAVQVKIHQRHDVAQVKGADPLLEAVKFPCRIGGSHYRADGGAADQIRPDTRPFQGFYHTDMRPPTGGAATQNEGQAGLTVRDNHAVTLTLSSNGAPARSDRPPASGWQGRPPGTQPA